MATQLRKLRIRARSRHIRPKKLARVEIGGLFAEKGFEAPLNVWGVPRAEPVSLRDDPVVAQRVEHESVAKAYHASTLPQGVRTESEPDLGNFRGKCAASERSGFSSYKKERAEASLRPPRGTLLEVNPFKAGPLQIPRKWAVQTALTSVYCSRTSWPISRPQPDCLYPPNGRAASNTL